MTTFIMSCRNQEKCYNGTWELYRYSANHIPLSYLLLGSKSDSLDKYNTVFLNFNGKKISWSTNDSVFLSGELIPNNSDSIIIIGYDSILDTLHINVENMKLMVLTNITRTDTLFFKFVNDQICK